MTDEAPDALLEAARDVELPTLGHFLETGFCDRRLRPVGAVGRMTGPAMTVDLVEPDAIAVNHALLRLEAGSVLVIRVRSGRHAPIGAVTAAAAIARGAAGIVVDGPVTDIGALRASAPLLPIFADGSTALTTKRLGMGLEAIGGPVEIGGVRVTQGAIVAGDENGVMVLDPGTLDPSVLDAARRSDAAEPDLIERIRRGDPLKELLAFHPQTVHRRPQ